MLPQLASPLVSPQWLADHLGSESLVVLDASVLAVMPPGGGPAQLLSGRGRHLVHGHVPGAVFADVLESSGTDVAGAGAGTYFARPSAERLAAAVSASGVDAEAAVVVYDSADGRWAAHLWWQLHAFGHENVAVLDGGYRRWFAEDRPVETGPVEPREALFDAVAHPQHWAGRDEVQQVLDGDAEGTVVFAGDAPAGAHFSGGVHLPASSLVDPETGRFLKPKRLRERVESALGVPPGRVIVHCESGIAASALALALASLGATEVAVYDGADLVACPAHVSAAA